MLGSRLFVVTAAASAGTRRKLRPGAALRLSLPDGTVPLLKGAKLTAAREMNVAERVLAAGDVAAFISRNLRERLTYATSG